jgi:hypothetical protein
MGGGAASGIGQPLSYGGGPGISGGQHSNGGMSSHMGGPGDMSGHAGGLLQSQSNTSSLFEIKKRSIDFQNVSTTFKHIKRGYGPSQSKNAPFQINLIKWLSNDFIMSKQSSTLLPIFEICPRPKSRP